MIIMKKKGGESREKQNLTAIPKLGLNAAPMPAAFPNSNHACKATIPSLTTSLPPGPLTQLGYLFANSNGLFAALQFVSCPIKNASSGHGITVKYPPTHVIASTATGITTRVLTIAPNQNIVRNIPRAMLIQLVPPHIIPRHRHPRFRQRHKDDNDTLAVDAAAKGPRHDHQGSDIAEADERPDGVAVQFVEAEKAVGGAEAGQELGDHEDADGEDGGQMQGDGEAVPARAVVEPVARGDGAGEDGVEAEVGEAEEGEC